MRNKQQLKNAILLLLALSILAIYIYSKVGSTQKASVKVAPTSQSNIQVTNTSGQQAETNISNPAPKSPSGGGIPAPKPNQ
jgi:uncharacterized protein (UPF0333 family)